MTPAFGKQRQANLCEFRARLVYIMYSMTAREQHRKTLSQKTKYIDIYNFEKIPYVLVHFHHYNEMYEANKFYKGLNEVYLTQVLEVPSIWHIRPW